MPILVAFIKNLLSRIQSLTRDLRASILPLLNIERLLLIRDFWKSSGNILIKEGYLKNKKLSTISLLVNSLLSKYACSTSLSLLPSNDLTKALALFWSCLIFNSLNIF